MKTSTNTTVTAKEHTCEWCRKPMPHAPHAMFCAPCGAALRTYLAVPANVAANATR